MDPYATLRLSNQLCFPLYAASKEVVRTYKPLLDKLDLTYTQYITMMAMWEHKELNVKELGDILYLDSGTLTPLLKKLESKGYLVRKRSSDDERVVMVTITDEGMRLQDKALSVPRKMASCIQLSPDEARTLVRLLHRVLACTEETQFSVGSR